MNKQTELQNVFFFVRDFCRKFLLFVPCLRHAMMQSIFSNLRPFHCSPHPLLHPPKKKVNKPTKTLMYSSRVIFFFFRCYKYVFNMICSTANCNIKLLSLETNNAASKNTTASPVRACSWGTQLRVSNQHTAKAQD